MKWNYIHLLILICVLLLPCNGLHADETCSPDDYPDQFPFYPEEGCDDVTPLVWDHENSVSILDVNSSGTIYVTGGTLPLTVHVSDQGFWLDENHTIRDSIVSGGAITVFTDNTACGGAELNITDGCSSVDGAIRSTNGRWSDPIPVDWEEVGLGVIDADYWGGGFTITATVVTGGFRYTQGWSVQGSSSVPNECHSPDFTGYPTVIVPHPGRSRCASTYPYHQTYPAWFAISNNPSYGNNISCGWGSYEGRCETIYVEEWTCP